MLSKYSGMHAKVMAMGKKLLTNEDYETLLSLTTVGKVASFLKETDGYKDVLGEISDLTVHRGDLEKEIVKTFFTDVVKINGFAGIDDKRLFRVYVLKFEIDVLKRLLREQFSGDKQMEIYVPDYYKKYLTIDIEALQNSENLDSLIENLRDTGYYTALSRFLTNKEMTNMFSLEMTLDDYYFKQVWKTVNKIFSGKNLSLIQGSLGSEIDILNIMWIIRCKQFYNTPKEIIYAYLIPIHHKLKQQQLVALVEAKDVDEIWKLIRDTKYNDVFTQGNYIEVSFEKYMANKFLWRYRKEPFTIACPLGYLHLKENEIANIVKIIEAIRYNVDMKVIEKYLIRAGEISVG